MTIHASENPARIHHKTRDRGTAASLVKHERRHKSMEGKYGIIGPGATLSGTSVQSNGGSSGLLSYPGVTFDSTGIKAYNSGGVITFQVNAADGSVSVNGTGVITGGTIQTSATNPRVIMDGSGLRGYNGAGTNTFNLSGADGSLTVNGGTITGGTIQTASGSTSRVVMDTGGIRAYDSLGNNTVNVDTTGTLTVAKGSITLSSAIPAGTGARVTLDSTGIKGYNASNTRQFQLDATSGLITATGVITAQAGSAIPTATITGQLPGGANRLSNSNFQDGNGAYSSTNWGFGNFSSVTLSTGVVPPVVGKGSLFWTVNTAGNFTITPNVAASGGFAGDPTDPYKAVVPGLNYTFSWYIWPVTNARGVKIDIKWYDKSGTLLSTLTGTTSSALPTGQWSRHQVTAVPPANAAFAVPTFTGVSAAASDQFYFNAFQMEMGDQASAYMPRPDEILYNSINANMIQAGTITADRMNVTSLSAISAALGSITSGTVTSATVQSNASVTTSGGSILDGSGFRHYASGNSTPIVNLSGSGAAITGAISATQLNLPCGEISQLSTSPTPVPTINNSLQWLRPSNGFVIGLVGADVLTYTDLTSPGNLWATVSSTAIPPTTSDHAQNMLQTANSSGTIESSLYVDYSANSGFSSVHAQAGNHVYQIIDNSNNSGFIKVPDNISPLNRQVDWGNAQVTATSGTAFSFNHNLGVKPAWVCAFSYGGQTGQYYSTAQTTTTVSFKCTISLSANYVCWMVAV